VDEDRHEASTGGLLERLIRDDFVDVHETHYQHEQHVNRQVHDEDKEVRVVFYSHAVVNPLTVVIEPLHTLIADVAVARVSGANYFAGGTQHVGVELLDQAQERHLGRVLHVTRLLGDGQVEED